jgi:hypothetical protein
MSYHGDRSCAQRYKKCEQTKGPCDDKRNITFWLDDQGRWKNCELASDFYVALVTAPIVASWSWLLAAVVSSVGWALLFNEGVFTTPINETAFRYTLYIVSAMSAGIFVVQAWRRSEMAKNFYKLAAATRALMLGIQTHVVRDVVGSEASVKIISHDNSQFVEVAAPAKMLPKRLAIVLNAILVARRHSLHGDLAAKDLPLYGDQIAELCASVGPACIDTLYAMAAHLIAVMETNGATSASFSSKWLLHDLHKAIAKTDMTPAFPRIWTMAIWWSELVLTVLLPLLFTRLYPGYNVVWIAPLVLNFYYTAMSYAAAQCTMMTHHMQNTWSDVAIVRLINCTANDNYATAATIGRIIYDIKNPAAAPAVAAPPQKGPPARAPPQPGGGGAQPVQANFISSSSLYGGTTL